VAQGEVEHAPVAFNNRHIGEYILHARFIEQNTLNLHGVIFFMFDPNKRFIGRIDGDSGALRDGVWTVNGARITSAGLAPVMSRLALPLNRSQYCTDSGVFCRSRNPLFLAIPGFIHILERAGFPALRHRLYFHSQLALPHTTILAWFLSAHYFRFRLPRKGRSGLLIVIGVATGFTFYFLLESRLCVRSIRSVCRYALAAWAPSLPGHDGRPLPYYYVTKIVAIDGFFRYR